jgi:hypothetical protein
MSSRDHTAPNGKARDDNVVHLFPPAEQAPTQERWGSPYPAHGEWLCHRRERLPVAHVHAGLKETLRAPTRLRLEDLIRDQDQLLEQIQAPWRHRNTY